MSTKIQWATDTWNPITGCTPISPGCANCYARRMAKRLAGRCGYPAGDGFAVTVHPERMSDPVRWRKPRRIFVCSMGDLFHADVPLHIQDQVFCVANPANSQTPHTYLFLTKRPAAIRDRIFDFQHMTHCGYTFDDHHWFGVTAENQACANERIPILMSIAVKRRWISFEPLLERIVWRDEWRPDWVVVGGETGPGARPCDPTWILHIVQCCRARHIPVFVKQLGSNVSGGYSGYTPLLHNKRGADIAEWPAALRVREIPCT